MRWALDELHRDTSPFADSTGVPPGAVWAEPGIVIVVEYREMTPDRRLRAPVFKGIDRVPPSEVTFDTEVGPAG